jgi:hypothetical protein
MNPFIQLKKATLVFLVAFGLAFFGLSPAVQAVSPAPDGGYPGANTAEGQGALLSLTTGTYNTAVGIDSLRSDTTSSFNTALGAGALVSNTGTENTATGVGALLSNTNGMTNTANGAFALVDNVTGNANTAVGDRALQDNTGNGNTAVGYAALLNNAGGNGNVAIGFQALTLLTSGIQNIAIGDAAGLGVTTANHTICIGTDGNNVDNACYIGNIFGSTSSGGIAVLVNTNGRLGTMTSSRRFKEEIKPMDKASEAIMGLKPVTFHYRKEIDPEGKSQFGLVAEDVEKVNPDLVVRDKEGKPYSVRYDQVNAMLLNEFLKAHSTVQELKKEVAALTVGLQKVSAQLEASKPAPQVVKNP